NAKAPYSFQWNSPAWNTAADYASRGHNAQTEMRRFKTLEEYQQATKQDTHSVLLDYDIFMNVPRLDGRDVKTVQKIYDAKDFDFRLKPGAAAVDRGVALANVTDGFAGRAPDLGAIELGQAPPHYGPRPYIYLPTRFSTNRYARIAVFSRDPETTISSSVNVPCARL